MEYRIKHLTKSVVLINNTIINLSVNWLKDIQAIYPEFTETQFKEEILLQVPEIDNYQVTKEIKNIIPEKQEEITKIIPEKQEENNTEVGLKIESFKSKKSKHK